MNNLSVVPTPLADRARYSAVRPGEVEAANEDLYDSAAYAAAGQTSLPFFQTPRGQASKTYEDTNMELAGQLSAGVSFEVRAIEIAFYPGVLPGLRDTSANATGIDDFANDVWTVFKSGFLELNILAKTYIRVAPLGKMPFSNHLAGFGTASDTTTAGTGQFMRTSYAAWSGMQFKITPVLLMPNMNFNITLNWGSVLALPSGIAGRVQVFLRGIKDRVSQ